MAIACLARTDLMQFESLIIAGTRTGAAAGAVYGWRVKNWKVSRADGEMLAGATAEGSASLSVIVPRPHEVALRTFGGVALS